LLGIEVVDKVDNRTVTHAKAKAAVPEARRLNPNHSVKWLAKHKPVLQFAFDGLRKAGLPEE
jgi:hypothetical protein